MAKRVTVALVVLALLTAAGVWAFWPGKPPVDPEVAHAVELQTQLSKAIEEPEQIKDHMQTITELRDSMIKMTPEQRMEVMNGPGGPRERMRKDAQAYAELPPEERANYLDEKIDEMQRMMESLRQMGPPPQMAEGQGGRRFNMDGDRRDRARNMLNNSTPEERAAVSEYFQAIMDRRRERGMPGFPGMR